MRKGWLVLVAGLLVTPFAFADQAVDVVGLHGSVTTSDVTCAVTATAMPTTALSGRRSVVLVNISDANVFIGSSAVTTSNGFQVATTASLALDATESIPLYCISAAGGKHVRVLEIR